MSIPYNLLSEVFGDSMKDIAMPDRLVMHPHAYSALLEAKAFWRQVYFRSAQYAAQVKAKRRTRKNRR